MKKMQIHLLKILLPLWFLLPLASVAAPATDLQRADSLFKAKQYTQSFDNYLLVLQTKSYSPSMLLKMAFIQEGLGHVSKAIYYLQLYDKTTHDEQALEKIAELAAKNKLAGYEPQSFSILLASISRYHVQITCGLAALMILFMAFMVAQKRKQASPWAAGMACAFFAVVMVVQVNFGQASRQGIVAQSSTYLMSGPSAGASVVAIIEEGHQVEIKGKEDVWLRVEWLEKDVYVKEDKILKPEI